MNTNNEINRATLILTQLLELDLTEEDAIELSTILYEAEIEDFTELCFGYRCIHEDVLEDILREDICINMEGLGWEDLIKTVGFDSHYLKKVSAEVKFYQTMGVHTYFGTNKSPINIDCGTYIYHLFEV